MGVKSYILYNNPTYNRISIPIKAYFNQKTILHSFKMLIILIKTLSLLFLLISIFFDKMRMFNKYQILLNHKTLNVNSNRI